MLDPRVLRNDPEAVARQLARRGFVFDADAYRDLDARRKTLQARAEELQAERNQRSKSIGKAKAAGEDIEPLKAAVAGLGEQLEAAKAELEAVQAEQDAVREGLPNLPDPAMPEGHDEADNVVLREVGDRPHLLGAGLERLLDGIDQHEIVAQAVHLREFALHPPMIEQPPLPARPRARIMSRWKTGPSTAARPGVR